MIRLARAVFVLLLFQLLIGCAFLHSFDSDLDKQIDKWMAQHEYTKILDTLQYVRPTHSKYKLLQAKRKQAIEESKRYEQEQIAKALTQIEKEQWHQAELTLNSALQKLPDSKPLHTTYDEFVKQRAQYLKRLYYKLYINKAEWLVKNKGVQQELKRTIPDDRQTQQAMNEYLKETRHVYQQLLICGIEATNINDLGLAEQCYMLANELKPSSTTKSAIADIQSRLQKAEGSTRKTTIPALSQLGRNLLDKSKQAMQAGNLKTAIRLFEKIPGSDRNHALVKSYAQEMSHRIRENVSQGIELGRKLYSQGQVEQALAVWNKLRDLDPENENLLSHIERAERVLHKVKMLRKEQKQQTAPTTSEDKQ